jgi:GT2 family glycosyltransferase
MRVLIGITSKNRASILPKAITSALNQTYRNKEVWVFDDASTDDTPSLIEKFPQVNWMLSDVPKGYVYARNLFMNKPGYDLYCSLDDDSWFINENSLEEAIKILKEDPSIGALGFDMLSPDNPTIKENNVYLKESNNFIGCGHIIRLEAAKKINFYTPNPGYYGSEEKDLSIRLVDKGYRVVFYKGVYVWHDKTSVARNLNKQHRSGVCNDLVFLFRRTPALFLWPTLFLQIFKHLKFSLTYKKQKLFKPFIQGLRDFANWLIKNETNRQAVSISGFRKFIKLK